MTESVTVPKDLLCAAARTSECPLLHYLLERETPRAYSVKIEWSYQSPGGSPSIAARHDFNYQEIHRDPWHPNMPDAPTFEQMRERHLRSIEYVLWRGARRLYTHPPTLSMCGGVYELLGREPRADDTLRYRPFRETFHRTFESPVDPRGDISELITEFSLEAVRGDDSAETLLLEPAWMSKPRAWAQGSSLT